MSSMNRNGEILRGLPLPAPDMALSAVERERRAQAMVAQIDRLTEQVATLTEAFRSSHPAGAENVLVFHEVQTDTCKFYGSAGRIVGKIQSDIKGVIARVNEAEASRPRTFMARLRWLVRG